MGCAPAASPHHHNHPRYCSTIHQWFEHTQYPVAQFNQILGSIPNPGPALASNVKMGCVSSGALQCPAMPSAATIIYVGCCNPICSLPPPLKSIVTTEQGELLHSEVVQWSKVLWGVICTSEYCRDGWSSVQLILGRMGGRCERSALYDCAQGGPRLDLHRISLWWWYCSAA